MAEAMMLIITLIVSLTTLNRRGASSLSVEVKLSDLRNFSISWLFSRIHHDMASGKFLMWVASCRYRVINLVNAPNCSTIGGMISHTTPVSTAITNSIASTMLSARTLTWSLYCMNLTSG